MLPDHRRALSSASLGLLPKSPLCTKRGGLFDTGEGPELILSL